jgi:superfamily II DNA or RNA helicase
MQNKFDRLYWVKADEIDLPKMQSKLTGHVTDYAGKVTQVTLWMLDGEWFGVPREWGRQEFGDEFEDKTIFKVFDWPKIKFPGDGGYWQGQEEAASEIVQSFAGKYGALLEAPCGSGKTLIALDVASKLNTKTLVVVHKGDLSEQWHETASVLWPKAKLGHVQQDSWNYKDCHVVTAMAQTLYSRRKELPDDFVNNFGMVIFDEGHRYPAQTFERVLRMFPARYRLAVSATWRRKDKLDYVWHWHVGNIEHKLTPERLSGEYAQIPWTTTIRDTMFVWGRNIRGRKSMNTASYISAIAKSVKYNVWLAHQVSQAARSGRRVLVVGDRTVQLQDIRKRLLGAASEVSAGLYVGSLNGKRLTKGQLDAAKGCDVILATYGMMSEGTDIPELDTLFFATPRSDVEQVVGRIQRVCEEKKQLLIVDPVFQTQWNRRLAVKREETFRKLGFRRQETKR